MEQIYQWFQYRKKTCWSFSLCLIKLSLKVIGWKEEESETELSIKPLKLSITHFKACCNLFRNGLKPALLISYTLVDLLI